MTAPNLSEIYLDNLATGFAVARLEDRFITYSNKAFNTFFPLMAGQNEVLDQRIEGFMADRVERRLRRGRAYKIEVEHGEGARKTPLEVSVRQGQGETKGCLIIECRDLTRAKQAEYMLDSYSALSEKNSREAKREKERVEKLLLNIMPKTVYQEMKEFGFTSPTKFENASVLMLDFVGFTSMAISEDPEALIGELNDIFTAFDRIVEISDCERIKTIGDAYMAVSGIPEPTQDHASNLTRAAIRMRRYLEKRNETHETKWLGRIGIASGPVIGSVVGIQKYLYDIFGPAVNLAARLEAHSKEMQITISEETFQQIEGDFNLVDLGDCAIKGFGDQRLFSVQSERDRSSLSEYLSVANGPKLEVIK